MNGVLLDQVQNWNWLVGITLAVIFVLGLVATISPGRFASIASRGSRWIDTDKVLEVLDRPIDIDQHVLRYSRVFGVAVALAALWLAYVYWVFVAA